jgi:hypothetical protein
MTNSIVSNISYNLDNQISQFSGAVLTPNGTIVLVPRNNSNIGLLTPTPTFPFYTYSNSASVGIPTNGGVNKFKGGVLAAAPSIDGTCNVIFVPCASDGNSNVGVFNPVSFAFSNVITNTGTSAFSGGCLLPTGNIIFAPNTYTNVGMFDPFTLQYSNSTPTPGGYNSATLLIDGRVVLTPASGNVGVLSTMVPADPLWARSPYLNKF